MHADILAHCYSSCMETGKLKHAHCCRHYVTQLLMAERGSPLLQNIRKLATRVVLTPFSHFHSKGINSVSCHVSCNYYFSELDNYS